MPYIEGITLPPDIPIDINTLSGVLYKNMINDPFLIIDNRLVVLIEHQSTINNNIPFLEFIVLYNGGEKYPDYTELRLSDAFKGIENLKLTETIPLELTIRYTILIRGIIPK